VRILIHPGFVKTATTTLQRELFADHPKLFHLGRPSPTPELEAAVFALAHADSTLFDEAAVRRIFAQALAAAPEGATVTLSNENFTLYEATDRGLVAERLARLFPGARVLFTIRRQPDLVRAWYLQKLEKYLKGGHFLSFPAWFSLKRREPHRSILGQLDYWPVIRRYVELFGRGRVTVLPFELLRTDPRAFAEALAPLLGLAVDEVLPRLCGRVRNPTITREFYLVMRAAGRLLGPFLARKLGNRIVGLPGRRLEVHMDRASEAWIAERCAAGNAELARTFGLDLARFGYPLPEGAPERAALADISLSSGR